MGVWLLILFRVICFQSNLNIGGKLRLTKRLRRIHNAWRFQFKLNLVFKVQWLRFGGLRCSPLNAALEAIELTFMFFHVYTFFGFGYLPAAMGKRL